MRYRHGAERSLPITSNSYNESMDKVILYRIPTKVSVHETTKICITNQQVIERYVAMSSSIMNFMLKNR